MSDPSHHPSSDRLLEHATGALEIGRALVVSSHVGLCSKCRAEKAFAETVGGALLELLPPADLHPEALARSLARIEAAKPLATAATPLAAPAGWIEARVEVVAAVARRRWAAPGVWVAPVTRGPGGARSYLLRVGAGMSVPRHTHRGAEMVCILKGAFVDHGETFGPGDFAESDDEVEHRPTITADGECVCVVAADSALIPLDWVGRLFQPLVGI